LWQQRCLLDLCGVWVNNVWRWNLVWRRSLFEWEKVQVCQLLEVVYGVSLASGNVDRWSWNDGVSLEFSVNSTYDILKGENVGERSRLFKFF